MNKKLLKFVSILLAVAMIFTSNGISVLASEIENGDTDAVVTAAVSEEETEEISSDDSEDISNEIPKDIGSEEEIFEEVEEEDLNQAENESPNYMIIKASYFNAENPAKNQIVYYHCSEWEDSSRWEKATYNVKAEIPRTGNITFAFDIAHLDESNCVFKASDFGYETTITSATIKRAALDSNDNITGTATSATLSYPDENWATIPGEDNSNRLHSFFTFEIAGKNVVLDSVATKPVSYPLAFINVPSEDRIVDGVDVEYVSGIKNWHGACFIDNPNAATIKLKVDKNSSLVPTFEVIGYDYSDTHLPVPSSSVVGNDRVYTYNFKANDAKYPIAYLTDDDTYVRADIVEAKFWVYIYCDNDIFYPQVRLNSATGDEISLNGAGENTHYISAPYNSKLYVKLNTQENCSLSSVEVDGKKVSVSKDTFTTAAINSDIAININGTESTSLYVNNTKTEKNTYKASVKRSDVATVYVKKGATGSYLSLSDADITITANGKPLTSEQEHSIKNIMGNNLLLSFAEECVAGKTVKATIKKNGVLLGTMTFDVAPIATSVTVKGEKNNTISLEAESGTRSLPVTFNKGVINDTVDIVVDESVEGIVSYSDGMLNINTSKEKIASITDAFGISDISVKFIDKTHNDSQVGSIKTIKIAYSAFEKASPTVKVVNSTDTKIMLQMTAPRNVGTPTLYYVIADAVTDAKHPLATGMKSHVEFYTVNNTATLTVAENATPGQGKEQKYNISVTMLKADSLNYAIDDYDEEDGTPIYSNEYVESFGKVYAVSKTATVKNASTKNPYYDSNPTLKAGTKGFISGEKNITLATINYNSKTTYQTARGIDLYKGYTYIYDYNYSGKIIQDGNKFIMTDSNGLSAGKYKLVVYAPRPDLVNEIVLETSFEVYEPITMVGTNIYVPDVLYVPNKGGQATPTVTFINDPKNPKFMWKIMPHSGNNISVANLKNITVDQKTGKIKVSSKYDPTDGNNAFILVVCADDISVTDGIYSRYWLKQFEIVTTKTDIAKLKLYNIELPAEYSGASNRFNGVKITAHNSLDTKLAEKRVIFTSSNTKVMDINAITGEMTVNGLGTTTITATAADGGGSKKTCKITVKAYDEPVGIKFGDNSTHTTTYTNTDVSDASFDIEVKHLDIEDNVFWDIDQLVNYNLKVKSGGTIARVSGHTYNIIPSAATTVLELTNNVIKDNKFTYTITNSAYVPNSKVNVTMPSAITLGSKSSIKITGLPQNESVNYEFGVMVFNSDVNADAKNSSGEYTALKHNLLLNNAHAFNSATEYSPEFVTLSNTSSTNSVDIAIQRTYMHPPVGEYTIRPMIKMIDGEDEKWIYVGKATKIKILAAPKATLTADSTVKIEGANNKTAEINIKSQKNLYELENVELQDVCINGQYGDVVENFNISFNEDKTKLILKATSGTGDMIGKKLKANILIDAWDIAGDIQHFYLPITIEVTTPR